MHKYAYKKWTELKDWLEKNSSSDQLTVSGRYEGIWREYFTDHRVEHWTHEDIDENDTHSLFNEDEVMEEDEDDVIEEDDTV